MKSLPIWAVTVVAIAPFAKAASHTAAPRAPEAEIVFIDPDKFTDVRDGYTASDAGREAILNQIRDFMLHESRGFIPADQKLIISITDLDLAGEFEPWRGAQWDDVRIVKDIYPPRMNLNFRLLDSSGKVIKAGSRQLTNAAFMMEVTVRFQNDPLRYEKALIDDWFRREFPRRKTD